MFTLGFITVGDHGQSCTVHRASPYPDGRSPILVSQCLQFVGYAIGVADMVISFCPWQLDRTLVVCRAGAGKP